MSHPGRNGLGPAPHLPLQLQPSSQTSWGGGLSRPASHALTMFSATPLTSMIIVLDSAAVSLTLSSSPSFTARLYGIPCYAEQAGQGWQGEKAALATN